MVIIKREGNGLEATETWVREGKGVGGATSSNNIRVMCVDMRFEGGSEVGSEPRWCKWGRWYGRGEARPSR